MFGNKLEVEDLNFTIVREGIYISNYADIRFTSLLENFYILKKKGIIKNIKSCLLKVKKF